MGSNKIKTVDMSESIDEKDTKKKTKKTDTAKKDGKKEAKKDAEKTQTKEAKKGPARSKKYQYLRGQVDKTITYEPAKAVELLRKVTRKHHATIVADVVYRDDKFQTELSFPHGTGKSIKVGIVDDKLMKQIEDNNVDLDILLATPEYMPRLAKHAKYLGPKGLMPNPKNGTLTKDPEKKKKELEGGKITIKTDKKAPLLHVQIGDIKDLKDDQILDNLKALARALKVPKIKKLVISTSMSPGIKVDVSSFQAETK